MRSEKVQTIFAAGIVAAVLDITGAILLYAVILNLSTAQKILQSVAAGAMGTAAKEGGWTTALIGLALHTFIALCFAALYYMIYPYWKKIVRNKWLAGILFGCLVWMIMNWAVVPIATGKAFDFKAFQFNQFFCYSIGLIIFMVGIPIALITEKMKA